MQRGRQLRTGADLSLVTVGFSWTLVKGFLGREAPLAGVHGSWVGGAWAAGMSSIPRERARGVGTLPCCAEDLVFSKELTHSGLSV